MIFAAQDQADMAGALWALSLGADEAVSGAKRLFRPSLSEVIAAAWADVLEECESCGVTIGPSDSFPWHYQEEDCRAIRQPVDEEEAA